MASGPEESEGAMRVMRLERRQAGDQGMNTCGMCCQSVDTSVECEDCVKRGVDAVRRRRRRAKMRRDVAEEKLVEMIEKMDMTRQRRRKDEQRGNERGIREAQRMEKELCEMRARVEMRRESIETRKRKLRVAEQKVRG